jgi:methylmalonyl-CoA/ethylmalonyl-CoA epimerase
MNEKIDGLRFDHFGIVVKSIEISKPRLELLLGLSRWTGRFDDEVLGVSVQFGRDVSGTTFELIMPFGDASPVANIAKTKVNVLNQVAYCVDDLTLSAKVMRKLGAVPISNPKPAKAFMLANVQFFLSPDGFVIELIEGSGSTHLFSTYQL